MFSVIAEFPAHSLVFDAVVSMKVIDRLKSDSVVDDNQRMFKSAAFVFDFHLDMDAFSAKNNSSSLPKGKKTVLPGNKGGEITESDVLWNLDSVCRAAATFPFLVATTPQKT